SESIVLVVRDEGVGIPADMLDRLFDLFYQQPQALDRAKGGLGLGLAIVKSLVELHGGTVVARSEGPGKGSEFTVSLPAGATDGVRTPPAIGLVAAAGAVRASDRRLRVLIVDDNVDAADGLAELVMAMGHEVRAAHDAMAAFEVASTFRPELCFLDIGLPVMDGYELAGRLRESQALAPDARMVAVTGYGQDADRQRALEAGFDEHMVKPVTLEMLSRALQRR
ncbi:MAG TPA: response regulator, partial [Polyangia bacterium]